VPTREGQVFFDGCRKIIDRYDALEDEVRSLHEQVAGRVRVAAIYSVGLHHMSRYLQEFMSQHPKANVRLEYLHPERVLESVEHGEADIGVVSYPRSTRTIHAEPWREEPMVLVCAPGHAFARRETIQLAALDGQAMVSFDPDLVIRHEIDRVLAARGVEPNVVMEFDNIETIKRAIEIDAGVALLPEPTVLREVAAGTLASVRIGDEELVRPLGIIHARGKPLAPTVRRFIELLRGHAHDIDSPFADMAEPDAAHVAAHA
jgi:DNA-binding transcriptional LysR family regulator